MDIDEKKSYSGGRYLWYAIWCGLIECKVTVWPWQRYFFQKLNILVSDQSFCFHYVFINMN